MRAAALVLLLLAACAGRDISRSYYVLGEFGRNYLVEETGVVGAPDRSYAITEIDRTNGLRPVGVSSQQGTRLLARVRAGDAVLLGMGGEAPDAIDAAMALDMATRWERGSPDAPPVTAPGQ